MSGEFASSRFLSLYPLNPAGTVSLGIEGARSIVIKFDLIG